MHSLDQELSIPDGTEALEDIPEDFLLALEKRGYELIKKIGQGKTRNVYLARYHVGDVDRFCAVKIPFEDKTSVNTQMNRSRRDLELAEVHATNMLQHPYIVQMYDSFKIDDVRINVEELVEGQTLEERLKQWGKIEDPHKVQRIFGDVLTAMSYLESKRIVHNDIKPSNILITKEGGVKLDDLQNASVTQWGYSMPSSLPTHGGTPFTRPTLLNAPFDGENMRADSRSELYGLGASLYQALTGRAPFPYKIVADPNGKEVTIGNATFRISLEDEHGKITRIDEEQHEKRLRKALKLAPSKYRTFLYRCLTLNNSKTYYDIKSAKMEFEELEKESWSDIAKSYAHKIKRGIGWALLGGALAAGVTAGLRCDVKESARPTLAQILQHDDYRRFSLQDMDPVGRGYADDILVPYMNDAKERIARLTEHQKEYIKDSIWNANICTFLDKRLISAWATAIVLESRPEMLEAYERDHQMRIPHSLAPREFVMRNYRSDLLTNLELEGGSNTAMGAQYLKQCLSPSHDIADVFAMYFAGFEEVNTARVKAGSIRYLPRMTETADNGPVMEIGYRTWVKPYQRRIIDMATALFFLADEEGNLHFENIPQVKPYPGFHKTRLEHWTQMDQD